MIMKANLTYSSNQNTDRISKKFWPVTFEIDESSDEIGDDENAIVIDSDNTPETSVRDELGPQIRTHDLSSATTVKNVSKPLLSRSIIESKFKPSESRSKTPKKIKDKLHIKRNSKPSRSKSKTHVDASIDDKNIQKIIDGAILELETVKTLTLTHDVNSSQVGGRSKIPSIMDALRVSKVFQPRVLVEKLPVPKPNVVKESGKKDPNLYSKAEMNVEAVVNKRSMPSTIKHIVQPTVFVLNHPAHTMSKNKGEVDTSVVERKTDSVGPRSEPRMVIHYSTTDTSDSGKFKVVPRFLVKNIAKAPSHAPEAHVDVSDHERNAERIMETEIFDLDSQNNVFDFHDVDKQIKEEIVKDYTLNMSGSIQPKVITRLPKSDLNKRQNGINISGRNSQRKDDTVDRNLDIGNKKDACHSKPNTSTISADFISGVTGVTSNKLQPKVVVSRLSRKMINELKSEKKQMKKKLSTIDQQKLKEKLDKKFAEMAEVEVNRQLINIKRIRSAVDQETCVYCSLCDIKFKHTDDYTDHVAKTHHIKRLYQCMLCQDCFQSKVYFDLHMRSEHKKIVMKCPSCEQSFYQMCDLTRHYTFCKKQASPQNVIVTSLNLNALKSLQSKDGRKEVKSEPTDNIFGKPRIVFKYNCSNCNASCDSVQELYVHMKQELEMTYREQAKNNDKSQKKSENMKDKDRYKCDKCDRMFKNKGIYDKHMTAHKGLKPFKCPKCIYSFAKKSSLTYHVSVCGTEKENKRLKWMKRFDVRGQRKVFRIGPFKCEICTASFFRKTNFMRHRKIKHKLFFERKASTKENDKGFSVRLVDQKEMKGLSFKENKYARHKTQCRICGQQFPNENALRKHRFLAHYKEGRFSCDTCQKRFLTDASLKKHVQTKKDKWKCDIENCCAVFCEPSKLTVHTYSHISAYQYECSCRRRFEKKWDFYHHVRTDKCRVDSKTQEEVDKFYFEGTNIKDTLVVPPKDAQYYVMKEENDTDGSKAPYSCFLCKRQFKTPLLVKKHIRKRHSGKFKPKKFLCDKCDFTSDFNHLFNKHLQRHTAKYPCFLCKCSFEDRFAFEMHLKFHFKDKFECSYCSEMFSSKKACFMHILLDHSKEERKLKVKEETDPKIAREKGVNKHENIEESRVSEVKECLGNSDENHFKEIEDENVIQSVSLLGFPTELGCKPDTDEQYQLGYMLSIPEMCAPSSDQELLNNSIEEMLVETTESNIDNEVENHEVYIDNAEGRGIDTAQSESEVVTNEDTFKDDQGLENEFEDDIEQKPQIGSDSNEEFMAAVNVENPEGGIQAIYEEDMGREDLCTVEELKNGTRKIYKAPHENVLKNAVGQPKQLDLDVDIEGPFFEFRLPVPLLAENLKPLWRMYCCNLCENKYEMKDDLTKHFKSWHTAKRTCLECQIKICSPLLLTHMFNTHLARKPYVCPFCLKTFLKSNRYWHHVQKYHGRCHSCNQCEKKFFKIGDLNWHIHYTHVKKMFCSTCGKIFTDRNMHIDHLYNVHGRKIFKSFHTRLKKSWAPKKRYKLKKDEQKAETKTAKISMVVASTSKEDLPVAMETDEPTTSATQTPAPEPGTSNSPATKFKTIDVPDSDVTIELYADGTLVTKDKSGTNYSRVKLEDLGLNKEMLSGNTDIELLIVQGDGKEVRACINTSILENAEPSDNPESDSNNKQTATVVEGGIHNVPKESLTGNALRPYKCSMCPRTFKFYRTFRCHEVVHTKEVTYTCHMCKRVFARETNLASHLELHQKKAAMGITEVKEKLSKDKKKVLKEPKLEMKEWKCGDCDEVFIEHKELKYHRRKVHCSKGPKQICPHCDKTFSTESAFQKHTSVHTGPFVCPVCHERNEEIVDHMKHMGDKHQDKTLTCTICDKVVLSKPDLYQHVTVRHEKEPEEKLQSMYDLLYQECQICQEKFLKKNDLANHMDTVHEEEKSEVCFFCDKSFIKKAQLNTHIGMQHKTMAVYECRKCLEDVAKKDLYNHGKVQHLPPYNCNECKTEYESRNEMEQHQFEEHDGGFSCKKCDVKFTYSHELRTHYKNHEPGSQPFLCDECGEGFEIKPLLKTHVLQQHFKNNHSEMLKHHPEMSGVNNAITCLICGEFNFDFKMVFAKHMRDDHFNGDLELAYTVFPWLKANFPPPGDPPTCDTCGREFLTLPALKAHMKDHEPSKTYSKKPAATPKKAASDEENEYEEEQVDFTHIEPRETEKAHKCEFCDESFTRKVSLKKHIKSRHKKGTTKAAIGKLEEREEEIDNELENELTEDVAETIDSEVSKSPRKKVKLNFCQICEEMFKTMEELISHVKSVHEDNDDKPEDLEVNPVSYDLEKKACLLCSTPSNMKNFFSRYGVRRHMRNCHGITIEDDDSVDTPKSSEKKKKPAKDKISTSLFNKKDTPKSQLKKPKSKKPLGKGAMNISINTDMDSTADEMDYEETNDISAFLGKNFNLGKAVQGMISDEMERDARECKECNESFSCLDTLKKHKILHEMKKNPYLKLDEEILGKIYACKQCKNMYSNALSLIHHNRSKHDGDHEEEILSYVDEVDGILKKIKEIQEQNKGKTSKAKKRKMSLPESDASSRAKKREKLDIATEPESMTSPPQFSKTGRRITKSRKLVEQFSCYKCNKSFDMERSLKNHIKLAHDAKESPIKAQSSPVSGYECSKCNRVFDEMVNLRRHTLMKHKERWEATGLKSENSASAQVSTSTMIYECDVCNQKFSVLSALRHHMISVHDEDDEGDVKVKEEALACTICSQEFASQHTLKIHMRKHTGEKPHTCCVCSNSFISKFKLHLHLKKIHAKLWMKKVHCKTCFALFDNEKAMLKHKDEHNRRDEEEDISDSGSLQHKCKECGKSFKWKKNLDSHMKFFHEETSTKTCGVCNKVFPNNKLIEEHMKTHSNNCNYCGKHYTSENVLKTHESQCRSKKTSEGKMTCDICKKNFASKAKLLEHMLNHTSIKSAKCDHCLESFKDESSLKSHKCKAKKTTKQSGTKTESKKDKLPTNKKGLKKMPSKFACGKCGKKFSKLYQVRDHKRLVHKISVSDKSSSIQTRRSSAEAESTSKYGMRTASERKASAGNQDTDDNVKTTSKQYTPSTPQASSSEMKTSSKNVTSSSKLTPKPSGVKTPKTSGTPQQKGSSKAAGKTPKPIGKATLTPKGTGQGTKSKKEAQTVTSSSSKSIEKSGEEVHKVAVCPICSKTLKMKRYLRDHLKNVHKIASEKINETIEKAKTKRVKCLYCRECHKMFWSNSLYEEHIRQMHPDKAALELDKQVMEQLIKTEVRSPPVPTLMEGDASDVQYKCEFCTSIMWTKDSFDDHIIEFHPEHVVEYGIPQEALSKSMDENSDEDPSNTLDVEVYQGLTCEQLSTQPVVRLQKMPASPSKKAQNLEVKEKGEDMGAEEHAGKGIEKLTKGQDASSEDSNGSVNDTDIQKESNRTSENENSSDTKTMTECDKEQTYDVDEIQRQAMETEMPAVDYYEFESNKDGEINTSTVSTENATPDAGTDTCEKSVTSPDKDTPQLPDDGDSQQEGQKDVTLKKECPESDDVEHVDSKEDDSEPCIDDVKKDDEITTDSPVDKNIFAVDQTTTNSTSEVGHDSIEQTKDKGNDEDVNQEYEAEKGDMVSVEINKEAMENGSPILELFVKTESEIRPDIVDDMSIVPNFGQYSEITDLPISGGQETGQTDEGNQDDPIIEPALQKPDSPVTESEQPSLVSIEEDIPAQYGGTVGVAETNKMNVLDSLESAGVNYNSFEQHVEYKAVSEQDTGRINEQNDVNIPHNETQGTDIQGVLTGELSDYEPMDFE
ncbi:uncharacterized protein LOC128242814 isoform X1 [Mya arenaria]|nr:uncharacterized protein LOC128242814 isoform X1 [Mya arenaria]